jgi:hypothetical protein
VAVPPRWHATATLVGRWLGGSLRILFDASRVGSIDIPAA